MNENLITSAILAIIATISTFCAIYLKIIILKKKYKRWKPGQKYVFCGTSDPGTILFSEIIEFKTPGADKTHVYVSSVYRLGGIDVSTLETGKIYSFKKGRFINTKTGKYHSYIAIKYYDSNSDKEIDNTIPFRQPKTGSDSI